MLDSVWYLSPRRVPGVIVCGLLIASPSYLTPDVTKETFGAGNGTQGKGVVLLGDRMAMSFFQVLLLCRPGVGR